MTRSRVALAVDGGNSKTDVVLLSADGEVLGTGRAGPFAPQSEGVAAAVGVVEAAVAALGGVPEGGFGHVSACLAGADLPVEEAALAKEFTDRGFGGDVAVRNDTFALLRAGASAPWGVAVVCGAGINAVGVSPDGAVARFPALGRLSGDWGGGHGLAEEALWHAVRAEDGRGVPTALAGLITARFGTRSVEELVLEIHFGRVGEGRLHELVPGVFAVASAGDAVARSLVERQAEEVAVLAEVCLRRLGLLDTPVEVVLGGGLLTARDPLLTSLLDAEFALRAPRAELVVADVPPVMGAALLALDHLGAHESAKTRLRAHYAPAGAP
ncbi:N-acetylglucosamine kinase [Nonomuraea sp. SYSU D8015]|uniref:N-acetylglucosamine kinase n=1 Tax=Nonomuraea sp. SYSU D8015 TaxID=2593644 RepID=UPI0016607F5F|nr:BadF/BadG/BcrA/BcrD ATPase family protein [Nonomuraea sp. SYSU D8015]